MIDGQAEPLVPEVSDPEQKKDVHVSVDVVRQQEHADVQAARDHELAMAKISRAFGIVSFVAVFLITVYCTIIIILMFHEFPSNNHDVLVFALGQLSGAFMAVISYYYGTTSGSQIKTDLLARSTPANPNSSR